MNATVVAIIGGIFTVTMFAVALSNKAQTSSVLQSTAGLATSIINAAVSPVTGNNQSATFGSSGANSNQ